MKPLVAQTGTLSMYRYIGIGSGSVFFRGIGICIGIFLEKPLTASIGIGIRQNIPIPIPILTKFYILQLLKQEESR